MNGLVKQQGLSLIELMIAMALGLVISAAAIQMLVVGQRTLALQSANSELRDSASYGLQFLEDKIAIAGLRGKNDASSVEEQLTNDSNYFSGLLLTADTDVKPAVNSALANMDGFTISNNTENLSMANALTRTAAAAVTNTDLASDQLTIQYHMQQDGFDCEGAVANRGEWVVERYFVRKDTTSKAATAANDLALACDAGRLSHETASVAEDCTAGKVNCNSAVYRTNYNGRLTGIGTQSVVVIPRVDYFKVLVGVDNNPLTTTDSPVYMTVTDYLATAKRPQNTQYECCTSATAGLRPRNNIVAVKVGLIARSAQNTSSKLSDSSTKFSVLGNQNVTLTALLPSETTTANRFARRVYSSTIPLLNAGGAL